MENVKNVKLDSILLMESIVINVKIDPLEN